MSVSCPSCDRNLKNEKGMKRHHVAAHGESLADKEEKECLVCGEEFVDYECSGGNGKYCSRECMSEDFSERASNGEFGQLFHNTKNYGKEHQCWVDRVEKFCVVCGNSLGMMRPKQNRLTCSENCRRKRISESNKNREIRVCKAPGCDSKFEVVPSSQKVNCSHKCSSKYFSELYTNRNIAWSDKIAESLRQTKTIEKVDELGHIVRSSWEKEVGLILKDAGIDYEYEPKVFELESQVYVPDFRVDDTIIEVKGRVTEKTKKKAREFMKENPNLRYIVVGSMIPNDSHIEYDEKERLPEVLANE